MVNFKRIGTRMNLRKNLTDYGSIELFCIYVKRKQSLFQIMKKCKKMGNFMIFFEKSIELKLKFSKNHKSVDKNTLKSC